MRDEREYSMTHFYHTERKLGVGSKNDFELDFDDGFLLGFTTHGAPCHSASDCEFGELCGIKGEKNDCYFRYKQQNPNVDKENKQSKKPLRSDKKKKF